MRDFGGYGEHSITVQAQLAFVAEVLGELFQLLEDYGPMWYSDEHRKRAITAMDGLERTRQLVNKETARAQGVGH